MYEIAFKLGAQLESTFSSSLTQAMGSFQQIQQQLKHLQNTKGNPNSLKPLRDQLKDLLSQLGSASNMTKTLGGALKELGPVLAGAGAVIGITVGLHEAVGAANDFQKTLNHIVAATGASSEEMKSLQEITTDLYNTNVGDSWETLSDALIKTRNITKLTGSDLENATNNALALKDVFEFDVTESVKTTDTMMKNFGMTSEEAFNLVAQGAQNGLDKSGELLDSANEYSPYFKALGFTANEMFDTFSAGLEAGAFNLDKVGDAVKEFNIRAKDGSTGTAQAFQALGMDVNEMSHTLAQGGPTAKAAFNQVVQAISSIEDPVQRNQIGVQLMGTQFEDLEATVVSAMGEARSQFDMTKDTMGSIREVRFGTIGDAFTGIGRQIETGVIIPIVQKLLPSFDWISEKLGAAIPYIQQFGSGFLDALEPVIGMFQTVGHWIGDIFQSDIVQSYFAFLGQNFQSLGDFAGIVFGGLMAGFENLKPAIEGVGSFLSAYILPVLGSIVSFVRDELSPHVQAAFNAIAPVVASVFGKIGEAMAAIWPIIQPILAALMTAFQTIFPVIKEIVVTAFDAIGGVIKGVLEIFGGVIDFITGIFTGDWEKAWTGVKEIFGGVFDTLGSVLSFPINLGIDLINLAIRGLNKIQIDVPDWVPVVGGKHFGFSIPEIPKIGGYAEGGVVTSPEIAWVGEGGDTEVIVPINNSQRSRDLWQTAGNMLGMDTSSGQGGGFGGITVQSSPTIVVQGGGPDTQAQVQRALSNNNDDLISKLKQIRLQEARLSFG
ncbi:phage tail tape measure protein [Tumebacillus flagellatus]|uniref:phage tail tape measure protein n=1 Tax=Tumebacillus flagellatus TaxID=1157490 RepID=UPI001EE681EB|nr:phage tail tape measure protein [Tumebacillus flagellatus]